MANVSVHFGSSTALVESVGEHKKINGTKYLYVHVSNPKSELGMQVLMISVIVLSILDKPTHHPGNEPCVLVGNSTSPTCNILQGSPPFLPSLNLASTLSNNELNSEF